MSALTVHIDGGTAALAGKITEDADFAPVLSLVQAGPVRLDLRGVTQISSTGVREWILLMRALDGADVTLVAVAPTLVRQLNMIAGFAGPAAIASVLLPYYCDACGAEENVELSVDGDRAIPSSRPCAACGEDAEFDDMPKSYLKFLDG